jgi:preprotein translocase subunit SecG
MNDVASLVKLVTLNMIATSSSSPLAWMNVNLSEPLDKSTFIKFSVDSSIVPSPFLSNLVPTISVSIALILIIVLQSSKDDVNNAFSGEKSDLFANQKARGPEKVINRLTAGLSIAFFILAFLVSVLPRF